MNASLYTRAVNYPAVEAAVNLLEARKANLFWRKMEVVGLIDAAVNNRKSEFRYRDIDFAIKEWLEDQGYVVQARRSFWSRVWKFRVQIPAGKTVPSSL